jgi:hypothetical protein
MRAIDDIHDGALGIAALVARGWGEPVPLIVVSRRPDGEEITGALGPVDGLRKPTEGGNLIAVVREITVELVR